MKFLHKIAFKKDFCNFVSFSEQFDWHKEVGGISQDQQAERDVFYEKLGKEKQSLKLEAGHVFRTDELLSIQLAEFFNEPTDSWKTKEHKKTFDALNRLTKLGYNVDNPNEFEGLKMIEKDGELGVEKVKKSTDAVTESVEKVPPFVTIEGKEYPIKTTTRLTIEGEISNEMKVEIEKLVNLKSLIADKSMFNIPENLPKLTFLSANGTMFIPDTLTSLTELKADAAYFLPPSLKNLTNLSATWAGYIPDTYVKLDTLHADNVRQLPNTFARLMVLSATSAEYIPTEYKRLIRIATRAPFNPADFPRLREIWDYDNDRMERDKNLWTEIIQRNSEMTNEKINT